MSADSEAGYFIRRNFKPLHSEESEQRFILSVLNMIYSCAAKKSLRFRPIKPEDCGALTSAPLITDGKDVWGYMDYQVKSFLTELAEGREVVWPKG